MEVDAAARGMVAGQATEGGDDGGGIGRSRLGGQALLAQMLPERAEFGGLTSQEFGKMVSAEVKRWAQVVKASGAKLE